ncbi:MAG: nucleotidyltransferase domain-containing protein [Bacteroidota bacterium]
MVKLVDAMEKALLEAVDIIVKNFAPDKVILFGSRATGSANRDSDYDLCILKSDLEHKRKTAQEIYKALLTLGLPVDIIVETPENFSELKANPFLIYGNIADNGEVLYEKQ